MRVATTESYLQDKMHRLRQRLWGRPQAARRDHRVPDRRQKEGADRVCESITQRVEHAGRQGGAARFVRAGAGGQAREGGRIGQRVHDVLRERRAAGRLIQRPQVLFVGKPRSRPQCTAHHQRLSDAQRILANHIGETTDFYTGRHAVKILITDSE